MHSLVAASCRLGRLLGIDIGTTTICGVSYDLGTRQLRSVTKSNDSFITGAAAWEKQQDPNKILATTESVLAELLRGDETPVAGLCLTGQMHGIVYVDAAGAAVSPLYTWQDGRGDQSLRDGVSYAQSLSAATGNRLATGMGMVTHYYNTVNKLVPRSAVSFCAIHDFVAMRLACACAPASDATSAASFGCFDLAAGGFDYRALQHAELDLAFLPKVARGTPEPLGVLSGTSIPVFPGLGDNQASFLGSVADFDASVLVNVGTGSQISLFTKDLRMIDGLDTRPFPGGGFLLVGAPLCGGRSYAILKEFFDKTFRFFTGKGLENPYERMNAIDYEAIAAKDRLRVRTSFAGSRMEPELRGGIDNIAIANLTPETLIAGFVDGIAGELHDFYELLPLDERRQRRILVGSGNGVRRNPLLRNVFERKFAMSLVMPRHEEEASLGAALLAGVAAGLYADAPAAAKTIST